ncbi:hypothetical protein [Peptostreptococcus porci]|uniref:hypothetical protein n=1 Tax=Peptostreptococcus porci TaxID=2652282 RepID=UPI002A829F5F|nr:hypothetical protein [Peptostreptococcus porci]MDY4128819.1 hypothetical protein [Peptostreptococcus porci]
MKKIINGVLFDTEKMELVATKTQFVETIRLYKGKSRYAIMNTQPFESCISELSENEFKELLGELNAEKYIELYGDTLEEA